MKPFVALFCFCIFTVGGQAQELFPSSEPASTLPKGVWVGRVTFKNYSEFNQPRNYYAIRGMYGITAKLSAYVTVSVSNHHLNRYPEDLNNYFLNHHTPALAIKYPYQLEGFNLYTQYRFFSRDGKNRHFRMAWYGEAAKSFAAHDEAEPYLMADNSGFGSGLIITKLINRLAISSTVGFINPLAYKEKGRDLSVHSGKAFSWGLQFGYLAFPREYRTYDDLNVNLYLEIFGKTYGDAQIMWNGSAYDISAIESLQGGSYIEFRPGIQFILNSKSRLDVTIAQSLKGRTFLYTFPMIQINYQKYFFK